MKRRVVSEVNSIWIQLNHIRVALGGGGWDEHQMCKCFPLTFNDAPIIKWLFCDFRNIPFNSETKCTFSLLHTILPVQTIHTFRQCCNLWLYVCLWCISEIINNNQIWRKLLHECTNYVWFYIATNRIAITLKLSTTKFKIHCKIQYTVLWCTLIRYK